MKELNEIVKEFGVKYTKEEQERLIECMVWNAYLGVPCHIETAEDFTRWADYKLAYLKKLDDKRAKEEAKKVAKKAWAEAHPIEAEIERLEKRVKANTSSIRRQEREVADKLKEIEEFKEYVEGQKKQIEELKKKL